MWSINSGRFIRFLFIFNLINLLQGERVKVKIYDHRAQHDPIEKYGKGPWNYYGYGYGLEYQYEPDGTYERQKGYGFVKAYGRDFCKDGNKSKCLNQATNQPSATSEEVHEITNPNVLNSNHLNTENLITNSASSNQLFVKEKSSDELENKLNRQEMVRFYNTNKNVHPDALSLSDTNAPIPDEKDKFNFHDKNRMLISGHINSLSTNSISDTAYNNLSSDDKSNADEKRLDHINYVNHINHIDINQNNLNSRVIDQLNDQNGQFKSSKQNSQLINTSNRPIYLASNHHTNFDDDEPNKSYHHRSYKKKRYDPFAEHFHLPKIVHPAGKQLKHGHHSYELDDKNRLANDKDDYDDMFESHILGATRVKPKFMKLLNGRTDFSNKTALNATTISPDVSASKNASESIDNHLNGQNLKQTVTVRNRRRRRAD